MSPAPMASDSHQHGDRVPHTHASAREYAAMLDDPARDAWQLPGPLIDALDIRPGMSVADVGTGSGYLLPWLDRAVAPDGAVIAEDIDPDLLAIARERAEREHLARVITRLGTADDPALEPARFQRILLVDTYHHVADRPTFLAHIARALDPARGRFIVVDFRDGPQPVGPSPEHKIARAQIERELHDAGFALERSVDLLPYQFVLVFALQTAATR